MSSITLYFCGTGHDKNTKLGQNALQDTFHITQSPCWIFDGPGSKTSIPEWRHETTPEGQAIISTASKAWQSKEGTLGGKLFGTGLHHNAYLAHQMILTALQRPHHPYQFVNFVGHSRGAVTAMRAAYTIVQTNIFRQSGVTMHLYLNDPVIGATNSGDPMDNEIHPGVSSAWVIQMEDLAFRDNMIMKGTPRLKEDIGKGRITIPMPGGHGNALEHQKDGVPQGVIGTSLLHTFLQHYRTTLSDYFILSPLEYCELYAQVKLGLLNRSIFSGKLSVKSRASSRASWVKNGFRKHTIFVNWHHASCFKQICPTVYNYIRVSDTGGRSRSPSTRSSERAHIITNMPFTTKLFKENGLFSETTDSSNANDRFTTSHDFLRSEVSTLFG